MGKHLLRCILGLLVLITTAGCAADAAPVSSSPRPSPVPATPTETPAEIPAVETAVPVALPSSAPFSHINEEGATVAARICAPEGYARTEGSAWEEFLRNQPLLPHGSPVLLHDGTEKWNQDAHVAVLSIDVGKRNLQQCADAALRLRCEFLFSAGQVDRINYHLTNGDPFPYAKYRDGYRLKVDGNRTSLVKTAGRDDSREAFRKYCDVLFSYAGTISVERESEPVPKEEMRIGDIFIKGGSPGHCVIVMDMCESAGGDRLFLLGQSYMPAQQIHILKNTASDSPWYSLAELSYPFSTPEWTFETECLRRMP